MKREQGGVLLSVLWIVAILTVIAFSIAMQVRGETERTSTLLDSTRAYYVASAGVDRALLRILWTVNFGMQTYKPEITRFTLNFPEGDAQIELMPENAKLDLNGANGEQLTRLLGALGVPPPRAAEIAAAIIDWRSPAGPAGGSQFDQYYLSLRPSFVSPHASFQETEELLMVKGITPELYYGNYVRREDGTLVALGGLRDCVSAYRPSFPKDVNAVEPAVLAALGAPAAGIDAIVQLRARGPIGRRELSALAPLLGPVAGQLSIGGNSIFSIRATGRPRRADGQLSDVKRTVAATFKIFKQGTEPPVQVLRWYDRTWVNGATVE